MPKRSPGSQAPDDINTRFGLNLRQLREAAGRTQTEVGQALGVSFQQIQKYENGVTSISLNRMKEVADFLRCAMTDLLKGLDRGSLLGFAESSQAPYEADNDNPSRDPTLTAEESELLTIFRHVDNPRLRRQVLLLLQAATGDEEN